jgi:hypothetical protein
MGVRHYDLDQVLVVIMGIPITEFADGDSVKLSLSEDDWVTTQGHHGSVIRAKKPNAVAELTVSVMQGSPVLELISSAAIADRLTGTGAAPSSVKDLNGGSLFSAPYSWIKKRPDLNLSTEAGAVEIVVTCAMMSPAGLRLGENRLA